MPEHLSFLTYFFTLGIHPNLLPSSSTLKQTAKAAVIVCRLYTRDVILADVLANLYEEGKVCLSILGTWAGDASESWK